MKDKFSRQIDYLRISITPDCNLFCSYCRKITARKQTKTVLTLNDIILIVKTCIDLGINRFRLTGGEPLLRPDCVEIVKEISTMKGLKDLSLTTNGILLSKYAKSLKKAGLKRINVSLDTLSEEKFKKLTGENLLKDILSGIRKSQQVGFSPLKLNVVLMKKINFDEVFDFINFSLDSNLQVRFIELMPRNHNDKFFEENFISADELKSIIKSRFAISEISTDDLFASDPVIDGSGPAHYYNLSNKGIIGIIAPLSEGFCDRCNRFRLTSDGKLKLCLFDKTEIDLKPALEKKDSKLLKEFFKEAIVHKPKEKIRGAVCGNMIRIGG